MGVTRIEISKDDNGRGPCLWDGIPGGELRVLVLGGGLYELRRANYGKMGEESSGVCLARLWPKGRVFDGPRTCARCSETMAVTPV